ncbi:ISL3 family transposase, partial [Granulicatella sp. zg-84]
MDYYTKKLLTLTDKSFIADEHWLEEKTINGIPHHFIKGTWTKPCHTCPHCHAKTLIKHGTYQTKTLLPKFRQIKTVLLLKRTRYRCKTCLKTCSSSCSLVDKHCCISKELKQLIALDLTKNISRKHICQDHFVSDVTVQRVLDKYTKQVKPSFHYLPKVLCIDEFKSVTSHLGKMSFICVDGLTHRIIDVLPSRQLDHLITYFKQFSKKARHSVRYLVMDMNANYGKLIQKVFPNAVIVTDRFHIIQHIHRNLNTLRI